MDNETTMPALLTQPAGLSAADRTERAQPIYKLIFALAVLALAAVLLLS